MPTFYSPTGNPEIWDEQPESYITVEEWKVARAAEEAEAEAARLAEYNSVAARASRLRAARDALLAATDKFMLADYPISSAELVEVKSYRQMLRDLPAQEGAPFDGGGDDTPWPAIPQL
ncbi:phage tail assembly chaperone [Desulfovibrio sp. MES5]|uniref:phage tail assembly chaperone n=1 Tax=Desulfovibrio sp. MES5 TaxID=1899016 RepID=UPI0025C54C1A|nr:phage tail assembly chaperone [Desulfovibrio sp. MES5]